MKARERLEKRGGGHTGIEPTASCQLGLGKVGRRLPCGKVYHRRLQRAGDAGVVNGRNIHVGRTSGGQRPGASQGYTGVDSVQGGGALYIVDGGKADLDLDEKARGGG